MKMKFERSRVQEEITFGDKKGLKVSVCRKNYMGPNWFCKITH